MHTHITHGRTSHDSNTQKISTGPAQRRQYSRQEPRIRRDLGIKQDVLRIFLFTHRRGSSLICRIKTYSCQTRQMRKKNGAVPGGERHATGQRRQRKGNWRVADILRQRQRHRQKAKKIPDPKRTGETKTATTYSPTCTQYHRRDEA